MVVDDEASHRDPFAQQGLQAFDAGVADLVVGRDHPADREPGGDIGMAQRGFQRGAADVVEVQVYALRALLAQALVDGQGLVVEGRIKAAALEQERHLVVAAGRADDACAGALGELPRELAHRASGRRDVGGVAWRWLADFDRADPGRQSGHAEHRQRMADPAQRRVDLVQAFAARRDAAQRPVEKAPDDVAGLEPAVARPDHPRDDARDDRSADLEPRRIRRPGVHAASQVGVGRQVDGLEQHITRTADRLGAVFDREAGFIDPASGAFCQHDAGVHAAM